MKNLTLNSSTVRLFVDDGHIRIGDKINILLNKQFRKLDFFADRITPIPINHIKFLGTCSTKEYSNCSTSNYSLKKYLENAITNNNIESLKRLDNYGEYYWLDVDFVGIDLYKIETRIVFNEGDADCNDGFWGEVWERNTQDLIANILNTGDCETTIEAVSNNFINLYKPYNIDIDKVFEGRWNIKYKNNLQLEQLIGLVISLAMCEGDLDRL